MKSWERPFWGCCGLSEQGWSPEACNEMEEIRLGIGERG